MKNPLTYLFLAGAFLGTQAFNLWQQNDRLLVQEQGALNEKDEQLTVHFQPVFQGKDIHLGQPLGNLQRDSISLHTLRFYLSHFVFLESGAPVFEESNSYHLLDLEDENSLTLKFKGLGNLHFDQIQFNLGIDSLTNISGAMGGDLDPTKGMFWTWQSGYINVKLEGFFEKCLAINHEFQFHLGGYLAPFQSAQEVRLSIPKDLSTFQKWTNLEVQFDLTLFFEKADWTKDYNIMSPSKEAVALSKILANSFSIHGE